MLYNCHGVPPVESRAMLRMFQIDAFASRPFTGNPAAVVPLKSWLPDATMKAIAMESNLAETAFFVRTPDGEADFHLRWFTPSVEVDLCGHATLASAHALMAHLGWESTRVSFLSRSGVLGVERMNDLYTLDFPRHRFDRVDVPAALIDALGAEPEEFHVGPYAMSVFADQAGVRALRPDIRKLDAIEPGYHIVTAPGDDHDFVSRFFAPRAGIDEDPVTGSAHCMLAPYWAGRLGKRTLGARQISARGGDLICTYDGGERVGISGRAVTILEGAYALDL
jgi:PhzF family phenazine biosynthesis protein